MAERIQRKYGPEDFLYYGQKVMVNPEMCTDNPTEPEGWYSY
jgi:hypothetical protein